MQAGEGRAASSAATGSATMQVVASTTVEAAALHRPSEHSSAGCWISTTAALEAASEPPAGRSGAENDGCDLGLGDLGEDVADLGISRMGEARFWCSGGSGSRSGSSLSWSYGRAELPTI